ncbi:MAG TPA: DUF2281 domain-containing protein [Oscillatoriaceae cyanobacterium]
MAIEQEILDTLHQLPPERQQELLDFAKFLAQRSERERVTWLPGFFEKVLGNWQGTPLERAPQGDYDRRDEWP